MCDRKCPLCGKDTVDDEIFCRDCQQIAENSYPPHFLNAAQEPIPEAESDSIPQEIVAENAEEEKQLGEEIDEKEVIEQKAEGRRRSVFIALIILFFVLLIGIGTYIYLEEQKAKDAELAFWTNSVETNTPAAYADYLTQYPGGLHAQDAELHIRNLRKAEEEEWMILKKSDDVNKYAAFLIDHPNSPYTSAIRQAMDSLSWHITSEANTADAYKAYLESVQLGTVTGEYQSQAQERYDYLSQLKTLEGDELKNVKTIVSHFYQALSSLKEKEMKKNLNVRLSVFYTMENISSDSIVFALKVQMKENKIRNVSFTPRTDSLTAIVDNRNIVFVTLSVVRQVVYTNRKKEITEQYVDIEINDKFLISKIKEKD